MAITYNVANNIISVIAYTSGTPANFTDLYNADKAGTLSLHARTGIAGTDGAAVATDRAERPADYIVLGGASNDLYITVANWNGTTATIRITGTDRDGTGQTEDIVVTANGNYSTTKWFKTITHTQVIAFTATSFDYDLTQGQWGVVWKQSTNSFLFDARIVVGDGSTATWFADIKKTVTFNDGVYVNWGDYFIEIKNNAVAWFGTLVDAGTHNTKEGCNFISLETGSSYGPGIKVDDGGSLSFYSCSFLGYSQRFWLKGGNSTYPMRIWNCLIQKKAWVSDGVKDIFNLVMSDYSNAGLEGLSAGSVVEKVFIYGGDSSLWSTGSHTITFKDVFSRGSTEIFASGYHNTGNTYGINIDSDTWSMYWEYHAGYPCGYFYRQYTFDLKVIDKDENNINGATAKIWDKDDNLIVDTTTASGVITQQNITYKRYETSDLTADAYSSTVVDKSPHTIEIKKAGYQTYKKVFTLYKKVDWTIRLIHTSVNPDQEAF